jgi:hypothetical protein
VTSALPVLVVFGTVKWLGYCFLVYRVALRVTPAPVAREDPSRVVAVILAAATCRTVLGLLSGHLLLKRFDPVSQQAALLTALLPVRLAEWAVVMWAFLPPLRRHWFEQVRATSLGTLLSYALDIPAVLVPLSTIPLIGIC